jgi:hypothetical protein
MNLSARCWHLTRSGVDGNSGPDLTGASPIAIGSGLQMFHGPLENLVHKVLEAVEVEVVIKHDADDFMPTPNIRSDRTHCARADGPPAVDPVQAGPHQGQHNHP